MEGHGVDFGRRDRQENDRKIRGQRGSRVKSVRVVAGSLRLSAAALLVLAVAGCAALGGKPAPLDTFELSAPSVDMHGHSRRQILIAQPSALKALDSQNIVIRPSDQSIQFLKGAQWADRLPLIVQARLAETFQRSGSFAGVGKPGEGLAIDYQIVTEIRAFEIDTVSRRAKVEISVKILNDKNGEVRTQKVFAAASPVSSGATNPAFIKALDAAFTAAAAEIVDWTLRSI